MRLQECDRPRCLAIEMAKIGMLVVAQPDYAVLYLWPSDLPYQWVMAYHMEHNRGDFLLFHVGNTVLKAQMPE